MANEMIKFYKGLEASLPASGVNGALYITTDEGAIYLGTGTGMKRLGDFVQVANVASLPAKAHESCLYYCVAENVLAKWNGTKWDQINKQPTADELKTALGLGSLAYLSEVAEANLNTDLKNKIGSFATTAALDQHAEDAAKAYETKTDASAKLTEAKGYTDTEVAKVQGEVDALETYVGTIPETSSAKDVIAYVQEKTAGIATDTALEELTGRVSDNESAIEALQNANAEGGAVATAIADAKKAGDDAQAAADKAQDEVDALETVVSEYKTANDAAVQAAQSAAEAAQDDVDALEAKVGTVAEGKTIVQMISDAQTAATYDDTAVRGLISAEETRAKGIEDSLAARIKAVEDDYLTSDDKEALQNQINTIMNNPDAEGAINSINEFTQYVADHGTIAEGFRTDIDKNKEDIAANAEAIATKAAQSDLNAVVGRMDTAESEIDALQGASHTHINKAVLDGISAEKVSAWDAAEGNAKSYADGLDQAMDARMDVVEGKAHEHANKALLDTYTQTEANLADAVAKKHEHANKTVLDGITSDKVSAWDNAESNAKSYADGKDAETLAAAKSDAAAQVKALADGAVATNAAAIEAANDAIDTKANAADVYAKSETYTKDEVAKAIDDAVTAATTWGSF